MYFVTCKITKIGFCRKLPAVTQSKKENAGFQILSFSSYHFLICRKFDAVANLSFLPKKNERRTALEHLQYLVSPRNEI